MLLLLPLLLPLLNASDVISEACVSKFRAFEYAGRFRRVSTLFGRILQISRFGLLLPCRTRVWVTVIEHALPRFPNSVELLLNLAEIRLIENTPMAAIGLFEKVAGINPKETRAWGGLVRAHRLSLEMPAGRPVPTPWAQWKLLGDRLMQQQKFPLALHAYRRALALQPAMADVHAAIADLDRRTGHSDWADYEHRLEPGPGPSVKAVRDAAAEAYRRLESFGASADLMDLQAQVERRRGNFGTAEGLHKMALETRPGDWRIEREYGLTLIRSHGFASAKPLLEKHRMKRELGEPALAAGDLQLAMSVLGTVAKDQELLLLYSRAASRTTGRRRLLRTCKPKPRSISTAACIRCSERRISRCTGRIPQGLRFCADPHWHGRQHR